MDPTLPSVTVAILNYNYAHFLQSSISSALGQEPGGYVLDEVVVIDDGSTDNSMATAGRFRSARLIARPHEGFGATLTAAVTETASDWVAFLDADDIFESNKLAAVAPLLARTDLSFVSHRKSAIDEWGRSVDNTPLPGGSTSTLLVRRAPALDLCPVTNEVFFHVLYTLARGGFDDRCLTRYRVHNAAMTDRTTPGRFQTYKARVCGDLAARLREMVGDPPAWTSPDALSTAAEEMEQLSAAKTAAAAREVESGIVETESASRNWPPEAASRWHPVDRDDTQDARG